MKDSHDSATLDMFGHIVLRGVSLSNPTQRYTKECLVDIATLQYGREEMMRLLYTAVGEQVIKALLQSGPAIVCLTDTSTKNDMWINTTVSASVRPLTVESSAVEYVTNSDVQNFFDDVASSVVNY